MTGLSNLRSLIGFGANQSAVSVGGLIDTTGLTGMAFSMPRAGTITSMAAYFNVAAAVSLLTSTMTVTAQIYSSTAPDESFAPIPGAVVTLAPALTGVIAVGTPLSGLTTGLSIPVTAGTRLLLVFSAEITAGLSVAEIITGFSGAGVTIE